MTNFPRIGNEESIKFGSEESIKFSYFFVLFSYFFRIQTEAIKQMVAGEGCCGGSVVSDGGGPQDRGPHDLFGGVGCTIKVIMGRGG